MLLHATVADIKLRTYNSGQLRWTSPPLPPRSYFVWKPKSSPSVCTESDEERTWLIIEISV